jgi:hypothetical protein
MELKSAVEYQALLVNDICAFPCPSSIHSSDSLLQVPCINNHSTFSALPGFFCISVSV